MATVRFSDSLKKSILENAAGLFKSRLEEAKAPPPRDMCNAFYESVMGMHLPHINALPTQFFECRETLHVCFPEISSEDIELKLGTPRPIGEHAVPGLRLEKRWSGFMYYRETDPINPPEHDMVEFIKRRYDSIRALEAQRDQFVAGVKHIVNSFVTLAPALKVMPALWDLLPSDVQDKHREIKVVDKKEVDLSSVDLDHLAATITVAKLVR